MGVNPIGYRELFQSHQIVKTLKLVLIWQSLAFINYGINFCLPNIISKLNNSSENKNSDD